MAIAASVGAARCLQRQVLALRVCVCARQFSSAPPHRTLPDGLEEITSASAGDGSSDQAFGSVY